MYLAMLFSHFSPVQRHFLGGKVKLTSVTAVSGLRGVSVTPGPGWPLLGHFSEHFTAHVRGHHWVKARCHQSSVSMVPTSLLGSGFCVIHRAGGFLWQKQERTPDPSSPLTGTMALRVATATCSFVPRHSSWPPGG
jgi:hypothetical protein